jgi:hypothetical protein
MSHAPIDYVFAKMSEIGGVNFVFVNNTYSRTIALMRGVQSNFPVVTISGSVFFLLLAQCQPYRSFAQTVSPAGQSQRTGTVAPGKDAASNLGVPKPAVAPRPGTWNYRTQAGIGEQPKLNSAGTYSTTVKDDGGAWTVTVAMEFPEGPVTGVRTLDKGTLILRKESFKHFVHPDQRWKPVAISLDFTGNKVSGISTNANGQDKAIAVDLTGPIFADATGSMVTIGCLPLAGGYSTTVRDWDIERLKGRLWQLKVTGAERVTVPAGRFDSYKVELAANDGTGDKETAWIAKDSRMPVKVDAVDKLYGIIRTEMVP